MNPSLSPASPEVRAARAEKAAARKLQDRTRLAELNRRNAARRAAPSLSQPDLVTKVWTYRVIDFAKLPDEYKLPDTKKLAELARTSHSAASVPGVNFFVAVEVAEKAAP